MVSGLPEMQYFQLLQLYQGHNKEEFSFHQRKYCKFIYS